MGQDDAQSDHADSDSLSSAGLVAVAAVGPAVVHHSEPGYTTQPAAPDLAEVQAAETWRYTAQDGLELMPVHQIA